MSYDTGIFSVCKDLRKVQAQLGIPVLVHSVFCLQTFLQPRDLDFFI